MRYFTLISDSELMYIYADTKYGLKPLRVRDLKRRKFVTSNYVKEQYPDEIIPSGFYER